MSDFLLGAYAAVTGDELADDGPRREAIAEEMRQVVAAPTLSEAAAVIEWWRPDGGWGSGPEHLNSSLKMARALRAEAERRRS